MAKQAEIVLDWQSRLSLCLVVDSFSYFLPKAKRQNIAERMGMKNQTYLSTILNQGPMTPEMFGDLEEALRDLVSDCESDPMVGEQQLSLAKEILKDGLQNRIQLLTAHLQVPAVIDEDSPLAKYPSYRRLISEAIDQTVLREDSEMSDDQVYALIRQTFPNLPRREMGFALQTLGEAVSFLGDHTAKTNQYAARLFKRAVKHRGIALVRTYLHLIRCYVRILNRDKLSPDERTDMLKDIHELVHGCELITRQFQLPADLVANEFKIVAEFFFTIEPGNITLIRREFGRAIEFYEKAIEQFKLGLNEDNNPFRLSNFFHNVGFCSLRIDQPVKAVSFLDMPLTNVPDITPAI